jgi:tellurite resistance protein TerC
MPAMLLAKVAPAVAPLVVPTWFWFAFCAGVAILLVLDMFVFHRHSHDPTLVESAGWTVFWIALALFFNLWVWREFGHDAAVQFLAGYLLEKSLSMDNVFVFAMIFSYFRIPLKYQYRVLFWGIFGAIILRLIFILVANELIQKFDWVLYVFGAFLIYTGVKMGMAKDVEAHPDQNPFFRFGRKYLRVAEGDHGDHFFAKIRGRHYVTTLFLVLLVVESTDVVFAIDSVPAIFGITKEPFIIFTSNVFAIMGLRALYFLLAGVMDLFRYLHYGLSAVLCFIGVKMLINDWYHIPPMWSLAIIAICLVTSIVASLLTGRRELAVKIEKLRRARKPRMPKKKADSEE